MSGKKTRIYYLDQLRAIAILMVILCHTIDVNYLFFLGFQEMSIAKQVVSYGALAIGRCGVPIFLMLTGYLMLDRDYTRDKVKDFYLGRWLKLLIVTEIWFVIYEGFAVFVQNESFDIKRLIYRMIFIQKPALSHAWYLPMILMFYLFIPPLARVLQKMSKSVVQTACVCLLSIIIVVEFVNRFMLGCSINDFVEGKLPYFAYLLYLIVGYSIKKGYVVVHKTISICFILLGLLGCVVHQMWKHSLHEEVYIWYDNPFIIMAAVFLVLYFSKTTYKENNAINLLSKYSFGIYLIHNMFALAMLNILLAININTECKVILSYVTILALSILLSVGISKIPKVGKKLLYM